MLLRFETLAIGDELLTGKVSDTNSTFVGDRLFSQGLRLQRTTVILDDKAEIQKAFGARSLECDYLFCFGGLGPTTDDITAEAVAELLGTKLETDPPSREKLEGLYLRAKRTITAAALKQTLFPGGTEVIPNPVGLAPGFSFSLGSCRIFCLPGVPREMEAMVDQTVVPRILRALGGERQLAAHSWRLLGIPESQLQTEMNGLTLPTGAWLGYRTFFPENHLTLYYKGSSRDVAFVETRDQIRRKVDSWCYGEGTRDLETTVVHELKERGLRAAFAESCTGGLAVQRLTRVPGASEVVWGAAVAYRIEAKDRLLGVRVESDSEGVSAETSRRLAQSLFESSGVDVAASITGFLPPAPEREGEIYFCVVSGGDVVEQNLTLLSRGRQDAQWAASSFLLKTVLTTIRGIKKGPSSPSGTRARNK